MHGPYAIKEELVNGETKWVAIRARGAEWSWLKPEEAVKIAQEWLAKYGPEHAQNSKYQPVIRSPLT
jgi:hypothetical protein